MAALAPGGRLGAYEIIGLLGAGVRPGALTNRQFQLVLNWTEELRQRVPR